MASRPAATTAPAGGRAIPATPAAANDRAPAAARLDGIARHRAALALDAWLAGTAAIHVERGGVAETVASHLVEVDAEGVSIRRHHSIAEPLVAWRDAILAESPAGAAHAVLATTGGSVVLTATPRSAAPARRRP